MTEPWRTCPTCGCGPGDDHRKVEVRGRMVACPRGQKHWEAGYVGPHWGPAKAAPVPRRRRAAKKVRRKARRARHR